MRAEREWPLARTRWTWLYLDLAGGGLVTEPPAPGASASFEALGEGLTFVGAPLAEETEITEPAAARMWVASSTGDADVFGGTTTLTSDASEAPYVLLPFVPRTEESAMAPRRGPYPR